MSTYTIGIGTNAEVSLAVATIGRCRVLATSSAGDAASPVVVREGNHATGVGQVADFRHRVAESAAKYGCRAAVEGVWDDGAWHQRVSVSGSDIPREAVMEFVRARVAEREEIEKARRAAQSREKEAAREREEEDARQQAIAAALAAAEAWAPGRATVWQARDGRFYAGRWDAPLIPGRGDPSETREVIITDASRFEGEPHAFVAVLAGGEQ